MDNSDGAEHSRNEQVDEVAIGGDIVMVCVINGQRQSDTV